MVAYAYLRVSTDHQDSDNQRHGILEYANTHGISSVQFVKDAVSGQVKWQTRAVGKLLTETAGLGDVVIFAEISRMARSKSASARDVGVLYASRHYCSYR